MAKIFISYTAKDRAWAQWIGVTLREHGHTPFVHEWEIGAGQNIPHWMNEKLELADNLLGVFSDAYTQAIYSGAERDAAFWEDPSGKDGFLVPVEVETVSKWPPLARPLKRLSLVGLDEAQAQTALIEFLTPPAPPKQRPPFPGRHTTADKQINLDAVFEAAEQANVFAQNSEPLPAERPAFQGRRPELDAEEQDLWANVTRHVEPLPPTGPVEPPKPPPPPDAPSTAADNVPDPSRQEAFRDWLKTKPLACSFVIAARSALRVLPLAQASNLSSEEAAPILSTMLRAIAIVRFASIYPNRATLPAAGSAASAARFAAKSAAKAVRSAAVSAARSAARLSQAAAWSAEAATWSADPAAWSAEPTTSAAQSAAARSAVKVDAVSLTRGMSPAQLAQTSLWPHGGDAAATQVTRAWSDLKRDLIRLGVHWRVWINWYEEVLTGSPPAPARSEAWEAAFTDVADASYPWKGPLPWDDGPEAVNRAIQARLDLVRKLEAERAKPQPASSLTDPLPLDGVASPVSIVQRADGRIAAEPGMLALPELAPSLLEDLVRTLAACRARAEGLRALASAPTFNARCDYAETLGSYLEWLPTSAGTGNLLLADGEARVLTKLFTADEGILPTGFAARLSVFLEDHMGLRAHYDEVDRHYQAVRTGRIETPLARDAVEGIKRAVHENTPTVFEESVAPVVDETAKPVPEAVPLAPEDLPPPDPSRPKPPRDPIAAVDQKKSRNFIFASAANRIWEILLKGKDVPTAIEGWHKTYEQMRPHIGTVIEWLRAFHGGG